MSLTIIDDTETTSLGPSKDGTYTGAMGGTEMMNLGLYEHVDKELLDQFNIIKSRVRHVDHEKKNILWLHDTWSDPESQHLKQPESLVRFDKLVFVSNYQLQTYNMGLGVPYSQSIVLKNAINPIPAAEKDEDVVRLIYHTTPHRGLELVYPVVEHLAKEFGYAIHLDVFSSFEAYGWKERDQPYLELFDKIRNHPQMTYHGYQPNNIIRQYLQKAHIFAYPSIWPETSCIAAIEAMSAGCQVVCPNYAALPETTGGWARMYQWDEDSNRHANRFFDNLHQAIIEARADGMKARLQMQKIWTDANYSWAQRAKEWTHMLQLTAKGM